MGFFRRGPGRRASAPVHVSGAVIAPVTSISKGLFRRLPRKVRLLIVAPLALASATAAVVAGMMVYYTITFPDPLTLRHKERASVIRILARDGSSIGQRGGSQDYIPLDLLPHLVIDAVVATEDRRFKEHWGLDPVGLLRASFANMRAGRFAQGGSTLTQQLAKNLFLTPDRTMARKMEELVLAFWLEMRLSKTEILELYLNRVYFGGGAYGIEAAAQRFFDKSSRELTIAEAAVIAGLLKAPSKYSPTANPGAARARGRTVLNKMRDAGVITAEQEKKARAEIVQFASARQAGESSGAEYAVDYVVERLPALIGPGHTDLVVETTIDPDLQRRANDIVKKELVLQGSVLAANQAAAIVLDTEGGIRALVGGRSYAESQFNRAVRARRQPGSTFKPFVYLAALEGGLKPDSVAYDLPLSIQGWSPHNENGRYTGAVTLRHALAHSINTVAVRLILDMGPRRVSDVARRLGIKSPLRDEPSLALGTSEVSLLELASAYGAFGNGGHRIEPHAIRCVRMGSGRILYARTAPGSEQTISSQNVGAMSDMLNEAMIHGTGKRAAIPLHLAAGKTGTSQKFRDAWFVGYTAHLTAGVWVGNDNGAQMNKVRGGQLPAEIWRQIMQVAHARMAPLMLPGTSRPVVAPSPVLDAPSVVPSQPVASAPATQTEPEVLPWLVAKRTPQPDVQVEAGAVNTAAPSHAQNRSIEDFIARAPLRDNRVAGSPVSSSTGQTGARGKIIVRPPPGMMSLGSSLPMPDADETADDMAESEGEKDCGVWGYLTGC